MEKRGVVLEMQLEREAGLGPLRAKLLRIWTFF